MARSLVVDHQEEPSTNPLLTGFLVLAVACLLASAVSGTGVAAQETTAPTPAISIP